jgi:hypothetical protein|nr:MAG TPA: hypothetical protein [Caudoviricetes sp.]DAM90291.1 MAG TPA: hypothetical protein [Caudoviricetes sp.]DAS75089.1 MAG TPA: hypothetical protein [Caudoviricetes sp.]DAX81312.1 MAG TPA: hypothetical protein [Bacteriophage sp.]
MKVKAIQSFNDWEAGIRRYENEVFEITDERFEVLENNLKVSFGVSISDIIKIIEKETETQGDETTPLD